MSQPPTSYRGSWLLVYISKPPRLVAPENVSVTVGTPCAPQQL